MKIATCTTEVLPGGEPDRLTASALVKFHAVLARNATLGTSAADRCKRGCFDFRHAAVPGPGARVFSIAKADLNKRNLQQAEGEVRFGMDPFPQVTNPNKWSS